MRRRWKTHSGRPRAGNPDIDRRGLRPDKTAKMLVAGRRRPFVIDEEAMKARKARTAKVRRLIGQPPWLRDGGDRAISRVGVGLRLPFSWGKIAVP